jgi:large subunit ribosomal protein L4
MASVDVINQNGEKVDVIELDDAIFNGEVREHVIQQVIVWQLAKRRAGTACTKTRGFIRGGGKKPWRQKGTGRARAGSTRSPIWVGGGTIFGPQPRDYSFSLPKKVRKLALRSALSAKLQSNALVVVDKIELAEPKTKLFAATLKAMGLDETKTMFITPEKDEGLHRSSRNLYKVLLLPTDGINVYDLARFDKLVLLKDAIPKIQERLG